MLKVIEEYQGKKLKLACEVPRHNQPEVVSVVSSGDSTSYYISVLARCKVDRSKDVIRFIVCNTTNITAARKMCKDVEVGENSYSYYGHLFSRMLPCLFDSTCLYPPVVIAGYDGNSFVLLEDKVDQVQDIDSLDILVHGNVVTMEHVAPQFVCKLGKIEFRRFNLTDKVAEFSYGQGGQNYEVEYIALCDALDAEVPCVDVTSRRNYDYDNIEDVMVYVNAHAVRNYYNIKQCLIQIGRQGNFLAYFPGDAIGIGHMAAKKLGILSYSNDSSSAMRLIAKMNGNEVNELPLSGVACKVIEIQSYVPYIKPIGNYTILIDDDDNDKEGYCKDGCVYKTPYIDFSMDVYMCHARKTPFRPVAADYESDVLDIRLGHNDLDVKGRRLRSHAHGLFFFDIESHR